MHAKIRLLTIKFSEMKQNGKKLGNKTPRETMNVEKLSSKDCSVVSSIELNGVSTLQVDIKWEFKHILDKSKVFKVAF